MESKVPKGIRRQAEERRLTIQKADPTPVGKAPVTIVLWKWHKAGYRTRFTAEMVNTMLAMLKRNVTVPYRVLCITDDPQGIECETYPLWENPAPHYGTAKRPNCFYRLRAFDPAMRDILGERFVWLDLDAIITRNIDHILTTRADFGIWRADYEYSPCNGSLVLHRTGTRGEIWDKFNPSDVHPTNGYRGKLMLVGSDQAWIAQNLRPNDKFFGKQDGVYSYRCHLMHQPELPHNAAIVFFHGEHNPGDPDIKRRHAWVRKHYQ